MLKIGFLSVVMHSRSNFTTYISKVVEDVAPQVLAVSESQRSKETSAVRAGEAGEAEV
jgi:hypothetical protein